MVSIRPAFLDHMDYKYLGIEIWGSVGCVNKNKLERCGGEYMLIMNDGQYSVRYHTMVDDNK